MISGPSADCPENSTSEELFPLSCAYRIARPAMSSPIAGITSTIRGSTRGRRNNASRWIATDTAAAATPITTAQPNCGRLG